MRNRIIAVLLAVMGFILHGCADGGRKEMSPEEVAETFCRAVAAGEFGKALSLCDTLTMKTCIEEMEEEWSRFEKQDSTTFSLALQMLSEMEFNIEDSVKEDDERHIFCSMSLKGKSKGKLIILKKEEGEWKVKETADRP